MRNVLIVEDHKEAMALLDSVVREVFGHVFVCQARTLNQARQCLQQKRSYHLVLLDIGMPDGNGIDFIHDVKEHSRDAYIVMSTIYNDDHHLFTALRTGANGYLLKEHTHEELVEQLKGILEGRPPLSPMIAQRILDSFHEASDTRKSDFTKREVEVLSLLAKGFNRREIADLLAISHNTVSGYIKQIYKKLDVHNRAEMVVEATRLGLS